MYRLLNLNMRRQAPPPAASSAAAKPVTAGPPMNNGTHQHCWKTASGAQVCSWEQEGKHNATDIHNEDGVHDYHNDHSSSDDQAVAGKVPGTNVTAFLPPPRGGPVKVPSSTQSANAPQGSTIFEGKKSDDEAGSQDIHTAPDDSENHQENSDHESQDWKSQSKQPDSSNSSIDVQITSDAKNETLTTNKDGVSDVTETSSDKDAGSIDYDHSNSHDNNTLKAGYTSDTEKEKEEHTAPGVYDFHEESDENTTVSIHIGGGNGVFQSADQALNDMANALKGEDVHAVQKREELQVWHLDELDPETYSVIYLDDNDPRVPQCEEGERCKRSESWFGPQAAQQQNLAASVTNITAHNSCGTLSGLPRDEAAWMRPTATVFGGWALVALLAFIWHRVVIAREKKRVDREWAEYERSFDDEKFEVLAREAESRAERERCEEEVGSGEV